MHRCNLTLSSTLSQENGSESFSIPFTVVWRDLLRVGLGLMWIAHALLKWLVFSLPGTAEFFPGLGFPGVLAYPAFLTLASIALWLLGDGALAIRRSQRLLPHFGGAAA